MLLGYLFKFTPHQQTDNDIEGLVTIDAGHAVFTGHFPGQPVVPGACLTQLVKEVSQQQLDVDLLMATAADIKFLKVIDPQVCPPLNLQISYTPTLDDGLKVSAQLTHNGEVYFKCRCLYRRSINLNGLRPVS